MSITPDTIPDVSFSGTVADPLEDFAFRYGRHYDAYLVTEPGWARFWSRGRRGVVAMMRKGKYLHINGGLLAPPQHRRELLEQLLDYAAARQLVLTFFNIADDELPLFRQFGFQVTKWGEEALIDLENCDWAGGGYEWVRRQVNYCRRHGLVVSECKRPWMANDRWERLMAEISALTPSFLAGKAQTGEMQLLEGHFDPQDLDRKRIFVARSRHGGGRVEGFLACNPCQNGALWAMETYRQRHDAVRGAIPFLMHQAIETFKSEGVRRVSLCLIPGLRCQTPLAGDSALARRGLVAGTRYFGLVFDTAGAYHFKTRFRPRFENRYLCVYPRVTFGSAWAMIRLLGVLRLDTPKLFGLLAARWKKRALRATLHAPDERA